MEGELYDEFGNYIGPELQDSDESEEERERESLKDQARRYSSTTCSVNR